MDTLNNQIPIVHLPENSPASDGAQLMDRFGRRFEYLRLSITDVCNFKCQYCLPDGYQCESPRAFLSVEELGLIVESFARMGTKKVRITGGEPSLRKDLIQIIRQTAAVPGIEQVAITTNGFKLERDLDAWVEAGLTSLNVSVDSVDPRQFMQITGDGRLQSILNGVSKAIDMGLQVKLNAVLLRSLSQTQVPEFLAFVKHHNVTLRFIELMQTGDNQVYFDSEHLSGADIEKQLQDMQWQRKTKAQWAGPAKVYRHDDYQGRIGLIMPYSKDFCADCNRLRISSLGKLHLCLFAEKGLDLRPKVAESLKAGDPTILMQEIQSLMGQKEATHYLGEGYTGATQHLAMLGG